MPQEIEMLTYLPPDKTPLANFGSRNAAAEEFFVTKFIRYICQNPTFPDRVGKNLAIRIREFPLSGAGIADIIYGIGAVPKGIKINPGLLMRISKSQLFAHYFLNATKPWAKDPQQVAHRLGFAPDTAKKYISVMREISSVSYEVHLNMLRHFELWAIEAKIRDWRKAIRQATKYRAFANRSIILLPSNRVGPALKHISKIRALGIGLWSYDPTCRSLSKHSTPRKRRPFSPAASVRAASKLFLRQLKKR